MLPSPNMIFASQVGSDPFLCRFLFISRPPGYSSLGASPVSGEIRCRSFTAEFSLERLRWRHFTGDVSLQMVLYRYFSVDVSFYRYILQGPDIFYRDQSAFTILCWRSLALIVELVDRYPSELHCEALPFCYFSANFPTLQQENPNCDYNLKYCKFVVLQFRGLSICSTTT
jgi:hypothetical protein